MTETLNIGTLALVITLFGLSLGFGLLRIQER